MLNVLVVAKDDCIRTSFAEVLKSLGFAVSTSSTTQRPDAVVAWEPQPSEVAELRSTLGAIAVIVCTWDHRRTWEGATAVVPMPFRGSRVAREVTKAVRQAGLAA